MIWTMLTAVAVAGGELDMFPAAQPGFRRMVIDLPEAPEEHDRKVEVIVGRQMHTECAGGSYLGRLVPHDVPGWGYTWYSVENLQGPLTPAIACATPRPRDFFATVTGDGFLLRYNSRLPLVVHVPDGFEVRWRDWLPSATVGHAVER